MAEQSIISIKNVLDSGPNEYVSYNGQIVISHIHDLSLFRHPCHLNALTILGCIGGEFEGLINLQKYHVKGRSLLVNFPQNIIQITSTKDLHAFAVIISIDFLHSLSIDIAAFTTYYINEIRNNELLQLSKSDFLTIVRYISLLNDALMKDYSLEQTKLVKHLSAAFLLETDILHKIQISREERDSSPMSKQTTFKMDTFLELVIKHHSKEREIQFYAEKMCITPKYLSTVVFKASGKKASDWITEFVILEAKSMLSYSGMNIQEVARQLNFPTQSSFGKYFKSYTGISPSEYQNNRNLV